MVMTGVRALGRIWRLIWRQADAPLARHLGQLHQHDGPERVHGFYLPSPFSSDTSSRGARELCDNLGISLGELPNLPARAAGQQASAREQMLSTSAGSLRA